jgi:hypothetical protein
MGVSGTDHELDRIFDAVGYHPLLIRALAGEVAAHRRAPGDFDAWRRDHPSFDPFSLPLVQRRSHVLAHALGGLHDDQAALIRTVSAFRTSAPYVVLRGLFGERRGWSDSRLDEALTHLEDRGLLGWDRASNRYDLHAIVRGVVWRGLDDLGRKAVYGEMEQHFSAIPAASNDVSDLDQALQVVELFNALVGLERYEEACGLYFGRLMRGSFYFAEHALQNLNIALLESLFPAGIQRLPAVEPRAITRVMAQLSWAYEDAGRMSDAYEMSLRHLATAAHMPEAHSHVSLCALELGRLRLAMEHAKLALADARGELARRLSGRLALCEATVGRTNDALWRISRDDRSGRDGGDHSPLEMRFRLLKKQYMEVLAIADDLLATVEKEIPRLDTKLCQAQAHIGLGKPQLAMPLLLDCLRVARSMNETKIELRALCGLAEASRLLHDPRSHGYLNDVAEPARRGPYRLIAADAANIRARLERDLGNHEGAVKAARNAYRLAWCDGPPFTYDPALKQSIATLSLLGVAPPSV